MAEEEKPDAIEIWARRVGRGLGYLFVIVLAVYLMATYWPR